MVDVLAWPPALRVPSPAQETTGESPKGGGTEREREGFLKFPPPLFVISHRVSPDMETSAFLLVRHA